MGGVSVRGIVNGNGRYRHSVEIQLGENGIVTRFRKLNERQSVFDLGNFFIYVRSVVENYGGDGSVFYTVRGNVLYVTYGFYRVFNERAYVLVARIGTCAGVRYGYTQRRKSYIGQ